MGRIADLEREIGDINGGNSKYSVDGELFMLRDACHKLEHGKYEYEVCIFGQATQRDIGQKNGGTNLGSWQSEFIRWSTKIEVGWWDQMLLRIRREEPGGRAIDWQSIPYSGDNAPTRRTMEGRRQLHRQEGNCTALHRRRGGNQACYQNSLEKI
jgi:hypothetical protein